RPAYIPPLHLPEQLRPMVADPARGEVAPPGAVLRRAERTSDTGRRCHANTPGATPAPHRTASNLSSASPALAGIPGSIVATDASRRGSSRGARGRSGQAFGAPTMEPARG